MPIVRKIAFNGANLDINVSEEDLVNANNPSDISSEKFKTKSKAPTANSLSILKAYMDSAIIPQDALTFDTTPRLGSNKPVTSEGIYRFVLQAIDDYFNARFVVLTQAEYDEIENPDPNKFYMIYEPEIIEGNGST